MMTLMGVCAVARSVASSENKEDRGSPAKKLRLVGHHFPTFVTFPKRSAPLHLSSSPPLLLVP